MRPPGVERVGVFADKVEDRALLGLPKFQGFAALAGQGNARSALDGLRDAVAEVQGAIEAFLSRG